MKILHIIPSVSLSYGGPVTTMDNMTQIWQAHGIDAEVLSIMKTEERAPLSSKVVMLQARFPKRFGNAKGISAWLKNHAQDCKLAILHSTWSAINMVAAWELRKMGIPYLVVSHGSLDPFDLQKKRIAKAILGPIFVRPYLKYSRGVVCSTEMEADRLVTYKAKTEVFTIPWAVRDDSLGLSREKAREIIGADNKHKIILFLGRVDYKKGFPVLIPAMRKVIEKEPLARLLIVGPETRGYSSEVLKAINKLGLSGIVEMRGPVVGRLKSAMYEAADCFVLPSLNENFGNTVVEAMQHALPVIVTDNVYLWREVEKASAGIVCDYSVDSVAKSILKMITDFNVRFEYAKNARELGVSFSPESLAEKYANLFNQVSKG